MPEYRSDTPSRLIDVPQDLQNPQLIPGDDSNIFRSPFVKWTFLESNATQVTTGAPEKPLQSEQWQ
jgi:hypothetical protein